MPAFPKGRPAPAFPALKSGTGACPRDSTRSPRRRPGTRGGRRDAWTSARTTAAFLAKALFAELADADAAVHRHHRDGLHRLRSSPPPCGQSRRTRGRTDSTGGTCWSVTSARPPCPGSVTTVDELDGAPCIADPLPGRLRRSSQGGQLLPPALRLHRDETCCRPRTHQSAADQDPARLRDRLQTRRRRPAGTQRPRRHPHAGDGHRHRRPVHGDARVAAPHRCPRTCSASAAPDGSPATRSILAYVRGRGEHLPKLFDPMSVIQGDVRPPATFLTAEEILQRQYVAHMIDWFARDPHRRTPRCPLRARHASTRAAGWPTCSAR